MPKLTDLRVASLRPKGHAYDVWDGAGFGVRVGKNGTRSFTLLYRLDTKRSRVTLGRYPKMTLADARVAAAAARKMIASGEDPGKKAVEARRAERRALTVAQLCDDFIRLYAKPRKKSWKQDERRLDREIKPAWRHKRAKDVTRRDVVKVLEDVVARGAPVEANRVFAVLRKMFRFAVQRGWIEQSPCVDVEALHEEKPRARVLDRDEIAAFWPALDQSGMAKNLRQAFRFMLVTLKRRGEVAGLHRREISVSEKLWRLPGDRAKSGRDELVPLSPLALEILDGAEPYDPKFLRTEAAERVKLREKREDWIFPSNRTGEPYNGHSIDHAMRELFAARPAKKQRQSSVAPPKARRTRKAAARRVPPLQGFEHFTPHDLRRTGATQMRELGISRDDVRLVLGHQDQSVTGRVYDRYEGLREKRAALERWAARLERIIAGEVDETNIVELPRAGA